MPETVRLLARSGEDVVLVSDDGRLVQSSRILVGFYSSFLSNIFSGIPLDDKCTVTLPFDYGTIQAAVDLLHLLLKKYLTFQMSL